MQFILDVNNKTSHEFSKKKFMDVFRRSMELANVECLQNKALELSIALVGEDEIKELNAQYRKKNSPTDVLSFSEYEKLDEICLESQKIKSPTFFIGELILCPDYIKRNALEDGETFEYALTYITSHGILHLLGYPHGKKMFSMQKDVADQLMAQ